MTAQASPAGLEDYGWLAGAIAGRQVTIHPAGTEGSLAYSDGEAVFLPQPYPDAGYEVWMVITAQAALIGAGSLQAPILGLLVGRPSVARRYLYLEMLRATHVLADRLPWAFTQRVELRRAPLSDSPRRSLELAATLAKIPDPPAYFGRIRPLLAIRTTIAERGLAGLSREQQLGQMDTAPVAELDEDDPGESSRLLRLFQNPFTGGNPLSDLLNDILGAGVSKHGNAEAADSGGNEMPVGRIERALKRGINAVLSKLPLQSPQREAQPAAALRYPEWDVHAKTYRRDWVFVEETEAWREDGRQDFGNSLGTASTELRRQLSGLGVDQEMHRRQNDGSDLDFDALIGGAIDLRTGVSPPSLQVYRASRRTRRDLAITVLVDISGSTGEQPTEGDSIFKKHLQTAYRLSQALDLLGDRVAMFGFHSWGRKRVRVVRIKGHAERWGLGVAERMALFEPSGYTRIGAAIRHGTHVLNDVLRLPNRLLVLVSDGIAYDQDYELSYAAADASRALAEARASGVACVCLCVGAGTDTEKLEEVFGAANLLAVDEVSQVTAQIRAVCRHALDGVSIRSYSAA